MSIVDLLDEPRGAAYLALLQFLGSRSVGFALVWRDGPAFSPEAEAVRIRLEPFEFRTERTAEWPGTQLLDGLATVRHYASSAEALRVLGDVPGLYSWQAPAMPEDLSFYAPDGRLLFATVAHERDAWFVADAVSLAAIRAELPEIRLGMGNPGASEPDV